MKVAVCDDNREFCEKERTTIKDVFKQYFQGEDCQVDIYNDGQTIISNYSDNAYDMVFLDLELGDENGFDIAEQIVLMNNDAIIIFVTSHENLVYEAFRFRPLGYIVKDRFDREFTRMMVKIVDKLIKMRQVIELGGEKFYVDRVVSIATQKRKICVKSLKGEILLADSYTRHVAELEKYGFVQSSKGVLINMKYIKSIDEDNDVFVMYNNERVPISRRRKKDVIEDVTKIIDMTSSGTSTSTAADNTSGYKVSITAPKGAVLYVNSEYIGTVPCSFDKSSGKKTITLSQNGYNTVSYTISIANTAGDLTYAFPEMISGGTQETTTQVQVPTVTPATTKSSTK